MSIGLSQIVTTPRHFHHCGLTGHGRLVDEATAPPLSTIETWAGAGFTRCAGLPVEAQASGPLLRAAAADASTSRAIGEWLAALLASLLIPAVGALVGVTVAFVLTLLGRFVASKSRILRVLIKRVTLPFVAACGAWGAWLSLIGQDLWARLGQEPSDILGEATAEAADLSAYQHLFLVIAIAATTWFAYSWLWILEDAARLRDEQDDGRSSRFATQAQVLRRLGQVIVAVVGVAVIIFTFPSARQFMGGLLASAGLVSVIAGLAAQSTLSNVFAGLQLAFADAIRVGDTVVAGPKDQSGVIEEITLAYVVIRIWDERRIVIPSNSFTTSPFENWSRRETQQQGTVELRLDWGAPMAQIRQKVASLLAGSDLWDGRNWAVQVTDADKDTILVRIVVSAANPGNLFELRAMIRERMIDWIMTEEPWVRPAFLVRQQEVHEVERDMSGEQLARLAAELSGIAADGTAPGIASGIASGRLLPAEATATSPTTAGTHADGQPQAGQPRPAGQDQVSQEQVSQGQVGPMGDRQGTKASLTDTMDHAHAARLKASRQRAKKARRRALAERQRELAQGTKIAGEAAGSPDDLATKVLTAVSSSSATSRTARSAGQEGNISE